MSSSSSWGADKIDSLTPSTIHPYQPLQMVNPLDGTKCLSRADECKFLLVNQHWYDYVYESITYEFILSDQHILLMFLEWLVRWEVDSHTTSA